MFTKRRIFPFSSQRRSLRPAYFFPKESINCEMVAPSAATSASLLVKLRKGVGINTFAAMNCLLKDVGHWIMDEAREDFPVENPGFLNDQRPTVANWVFSKASRFG